MTALAPLLARPSRADAARADGGAPLPCPRVAPLDGLRTLAIALVVLYHFGIPGFRGGFIGVNVFFVLSGYLITSLLLRERSSTGRIRLPAFWLRRLLRLYPALLVMVLGGSLLSLWVGDGGATLDPPASAAIVLTYSGNLARAYAHISQGIFAPTWSLGMEEQFYLIWPPILALLLFLRLRRRVVMVGLAALIVASSAASMLLYRAPGGSASPDIYFSPVLNTGPLVMGCLLAIALTVDRVRGWLAGRAGLMFTALGIAGILIIQFTLDDSWKQQVLAVGVELPLVGISSTLLIAGMTVRSSAISAAFAWRPIAWFGRNLSYSLYLWHMLALTVVAWFLDGWVSKVIAIAAAIVVAVLSHYLVEQPMLRLKDRFEPRPRAARSLRLTRKAPHLARGSGAFVHPPGLEPGTH
jgi:peptidoglycan/LPS O-acetylase OafA/YrhL